MTPTQDREQWLTALHHDHARAVYAYARRRLDSDQDAEDVVVEVFATAWRRRDDMPEEALPWLYATAGNIVAHTVRSRSRRQRLGARLAVVRPIAAPEDPADRVVASAAARDAVLPALDELPDADAEVLRLWAWEQCEPAQIAAVLGCTPGTARTRLSRARARLREALIARGITSAEPPADEDRRSWPANGSED